MILITGSAVRFKGDNSDLNAAALAEALRGHAINHGSKVVITKTCRLKLKLCANGSESQHGARLAPVTSRGSFVDLNRHRSNGE